MPTNPIVFLPREFLRERAARRRRGDLESMLLAGLASPEKEMKDGDWKALRVRMRECIAGAGVTRGRRKG
jgi:hypothetical protein